MTGVLSEWRPVHELIGRMLDNRFQVASFIREGGMAQIFCGVQDDEPRHVAIKIMHPHLANNPEIVGRFLREAKVASRLNHPNIVRILSVGETMSLLYMVMELIVGDDISEPIKARGSFSEARSAKIIIDVASALQHAHDHGVVHRDIKPENIMVCRSLSGDETEMVKVLDFGIAKIFDDKEDAPVKPPDDESPTGVRSILTRVGSMIGTPAYMSPEQGRADPLDHRTDIYSMGVLLYELVTGHLPFDGATPMHIVTRHVHEPAPPPSTHCAVHPGLEAAIMRTLKKDPRDRQQTAAELADELRALLPELSSIAGTSVAPVEAWLARRKQTAPEGPKPWTAEPLAALAEAMPVSKPSAAFGLTVTEPAMPVPQPVGEVDLDVEDPTGRAEPAVDDIPPPPPPVAPPPPLASRIRSSGTRRLRRPSQGDVPAVGPAAIDAPAPNGIAGAREPPRPSAWPAGRGLTTRLKPPREEEVSATARTLQAMPRVLPPPPPAPEEVRSGRVVSRASSSPLITVHEDAGILRSVEKREGFASIERPDVRPAPPPAPPPPRSPPPRSPPPRSPPPAPRSLPPDQRPVAQPRSVAPQPHLQPPPPRALPESRIELPAPRLPPPEPRQSQPEPRMVLPTPRLPSEAAIVIPAEPKAGQLRRLTRIINVLLILLVLTLAGVAALLTRMIWMR